MSEGPETTPKILVVDDNSQNRALVEATLEDEGYQVVLASSGEEALAAFEADPCDCALLDVRMPGMDGLTLCRRLRAHPAGRDLPVVFLTALRDVETFDQAREAGGDDFLTKPVRPTELLIRVEAALKLRRLTAENRGYYETVREQRDALMRLQLHKEQLTAFLVHDLKNPVNSLDLHAQLLLRDRGLSERAQGSALAIRQEARNLMRLITNMLDISRSEAGELQPRFELVSLPQLADRLRAEFELRARAKEISLALELGIDTVRADPELLRRVLENLLDNSIRHAPNGTVVSLTAQHAPPFVEIRVSDRGGGIPEAMRDAVFERFVQHRTSGSRSGYGLGLAFCKLAVELHGGRIWVEDNAPGAIFGMRIPHEHD